MRIRMSYRKQKIREWMWKDTKNKIEIENRNDDKTIKYIIHRRYTFNIDLSLIMEYYKEIN